MDQQKSSCAVFSAPSPTTPSPLNRHRIYGTKLASSAANPPRRRLCGGDFEFSCANNNKPAQSNNNSELPFHAKMQQMFDFSDGKRKMSLSPGSKSLFDKTPLNHRHKALSAVSLSSVCVHPRLAFEKSPFLKHIPTKSAVSPVRTFSLASGPNRKDNRLGYLMKKRKHGAMDDDDDTEYQIDKMGKLDESQVEM